MPQLSLGFSKGFLAFFKLVTHFDLNTASLIQFLSLLLQFCFESLKFFLL